MSSLKTHGSSIILLVTCPRCGVVREVRTNNTSYPREKMFRDCGYKVGAEKRRKVNVGEKHVVPKTAFGQVWDHDPFATGQLPPSVTANALWS